MKKIKFVQNELIEKLLPYQTVENNKKYRKSIFVRLIECEGAQLAFNYFTKELAELNKNEYNCFLEQQNAPNEINSELIQKRFLVPTDFDEHALVNSVNTAIRLLTEKRDVITEFTILPTTGCNARCYYCFEQDKKTETMSLETAKATVKYILEKSKGNKINLNWFGGEPLVNIKVIDYIIDELKENNVSYVSRMISNGYLFDEEVIKRAKESWKLKRVQITLDGTEKEYNRIKNYKGNHKESPFYTVINNINNLVKNEIKVQVRLNVSDENVDDIYKLIAQLDKLLIKSKKYLNVYCINLYETCGDVSKSVLIKKNDRITKLRDYLIEKGLDVDDRTYAVFITRQAYKCMADNPNAVLISPNGSLCRCEHFYEDEDAFGNIFSDEINEKKYVYWNEYRKIPECDTCIISATCEGVNHCPNNWEKCDEAVRENRLNNWDKLLSQVYNDSKNSYEEEK